MTEPILKVTEPQTGVEVDLTGLSPAERALALMIVYRPEKYDGASPFKCLVGPPAEIIDSARHRQWWEDPMQETYASYSILSDAAGDGEELCKILEQIFTEAGKQEFGEEWIVGMEMAATRLGLDLESVAEQLGLASIIYDDALHPLPTFWDGDHVELGGG